MPVQTRSKRGARSSTVPSSVADVLSNPAVYEYADELYASGNRDHLYDLAVRVYQAATQRAGVACHNVRKPSARMSLDDLHDNILTCCACGMQEMARQGDRYAPQYAKAMRELGKRGGVRGGRAKTVQHVTVTDRGYMAQQLIKARRYQHQPTCHESLSCARKGIKWNMDVNDSCVRVTRSRDGGETNCYTYNWSNEHDYDKLIHATEKKRDKVLRVGHF